jgi:hypothetical protein
MKRKPEAGRITSLTLRQVRLELLEARVEPVCKHANSEMCGKEMVRKNILGRRTEPGSRKIDPVPEFPVPVAVSHGGTPTMSARERAKGISERCLKRLFHLLLLNEESSSLRLRATHCLDHATKVAKQITRNTTVMDLELQDLKR